MLYASIVERMVRRTFAALDRADPSVMMASLATKFVYVFEGDSALGGVRRTRGSMTLWWARLFRLLPGLRFTLDRVVVAGPPWRTRVAVQMRVSASPVGQPEYANSVMQFIDIRWGRLTRIHTLEDTLVLRRLLDRLVAAGVEEAAAPPIADAE